MYLPANAVRALGTLRLRAALLDRACVISRQRFLDHRGRELLDVDLPAFWGATGPCAAIGHRGLHELLRAGILVRLGTTVTALDDQGPLVRAVFADGSTGYRSDFAAQPVTWPSQGGPAPPVATTTARIWPAGPVPSVSGRSMTGASHAQPRGRRAGPSRGDGGR
jgi:hypothetical protein